MVREQVIGPLSTVLSLAAKMRRLVSISAKQPILQLQLNRLLAGGLGMTAHTKKRLDPTGNSKMLLLPFTALPSGKVVTLTSYATNVRYNW